MNVRIQDKSPVITNEKIFDVERIRKDFPTLHQEVHGKPLVYLDSAATSQKPEVVIKKLEHYYRYQNSNIHRGIHFLSQKATDEYEDAREKVREFLNAEKTNEIIYTKGTTESINLVASAWGRRNVNEGDEIIISEMEHHSNIVPWQLLCEEKGSKLRIIPVDDNGDLLLDEYEKLLNERTKLVAIVHQSNTLGTINPVKEIIAKAHDAGALALVDGAQSVQHFAVDVQDLDADFYAISGHKLYGPTGIGILYGKEDLLDAMPPYQGGGDMIDEVTFEKTTYNSLPYKFEAGTPIIAGGIGLGAAVDYVNEVGIENITNYEHELNEYTSKRLGEIDGLRMIGAARNKGSVFSFVLEDIHPHDMGTILDFEGIAIRTGHLCTQPLMRRYDVPAVARVAIGMYNTREDIDRLMQGMNKVFDMFR